MPTNQIFKIINHKDNFIKYISVKKLFLLLLFKLSIVIIISSLDKENKTKARGKFLQQNSLFLGYNKI